ncbi:MAG: hypothetical protein JO007_02000 [Alphaproteobacteria bacterium]|nr:hypothetical protein [Alphaproteobacteria bacterium]
MLWVLTAAGGGLMVSMYLHDELPMQIAALAALFRCSTRASGEPPKAVAQRYYG